MPLGPARKIAARAANNATITMTVPLNLKSNIAAPGGKKEGGGT